MLLTLLNKIKKDRVVSIVARNVAPSLLQTNNPTAQVTNNELSMALAPAKIVDITDYDFVAPVANSSNIKNDVDFKVETEIDDLLSILTFTLVYTNNDGTTKVVQSSDLLSSDLQKMGISAYVRTYKNLTDYKTVYNLFPFPDELSSTFLNNLQIGWGATNVGCSYSASSTYALVRLNFTTMPDGVKNISLIPHSTPYDKWGYPFTINATMIQKGVMYGANGLREILDTPTAIPYTYPAYNGLSSITPTVVDLSKDWTDTSKEYVLDISKTPIYTNETNGLEVKPVSIQNIQNSKLFSGGVMVATFDTPVTIQDNYMTQDSRTEAVHDFVVPSALVSGSDVISAYINGNGAALDVAGAANYVSFVIFVPATVNKLTFTKYTQAS